MRQDTSKYFLFIIFILLISCYRAPPASQKQYLPPKILPQDMSTTGGHGKTLAELSFFDDESVSQALFYRFNY